MNRSSQERRNVKVLAILALVVLLTVGTGTMVNVALPAIGHDLDVTEGIYSWVATAYTFTFALFATVHGRLAVLFGARRVYLVALLVFAITSAMLTIAPCIELLIALRAVQGMAAAAMPVLGSLLVSRIVSAEHRGSAMGILFATTGVAVTIGPFLGGFLVQFLHWRMIFGLGILLVPIVVVGYRWLPVALDETKTQPFDLVGAALLGVGASAFMWSFYVIEKSGATGEFGGVILVGVIALAAFARRISTASHPYVDPALFRIRPFVTASSLSLLVQATRIGSLVLVPILLIEINHLPPVWVGLVLLPGAIITALGSKPAGRWSDRVGARVPIMIGCLCMVAGNLVIAVYAPTSVYGIGLGVTFYGVGFTLIQSPLMSAVTQIIPHRLLSMGLGVFMMIGFMGGAFGTALAVTVVELHDPIAPSWLGMDSGAGIPHSNAMCVLAMLALASAVLSSRIAGRRDQTVLPGPC